VLGGINLIGLIQSLELTPERLAIELNLQIIKRGDWSLQILQKADRLEIVYFVGGG
jgi:sulfur carrier protein